MARSSTGAAVLVELSFKAPSIMTLKTQTLAALALSTALACAGSVAHAEIVTVNFSGSFFLEANLTTDTELPDGTAINGWYSYDTANPQLFTAWSVSTQANPLLGVPGSDAQFPAYTFQSGVSTPPTAGMLGPGIALFCALDCSGAGTPPLALLFNPTGQGFQFIEILGNGVAGSGPLSFDLDNAIGVRIGVMSVPLPATHALLGLGLAVAGIAARRTRKD